MNKKEILDLIKKHNIMNLATINSSGFPEVRAIVNLHHADIAPHLTNYLKKSDKIYIMTNTSSAKISHINQNAKSSLYFTDAANFKGLLLIGNIHEVQSKKIKKNLWHDSWEMYYRDGLDGGDFSILEFIPERYKFYANLSVIEDDINW